MDKSRLEELVEEMGVVVAEEAEVPQEEAEEVMVYDEEQGTTVK